MAAILVSTAIMIVVVLFPPGPIASLAWPWYVPLGTVITLLTAVVSAGVRRTASA
jgi:hypothetical protein